MYARKFLDRLFKFLDCMSGFQVLFDIFSDCVFLIYWDKTLETCNFVNRNPFLTILVPKFRSLTGLHNGSKAVKFGPMLTKLGTNEVYHVQKNAVYEKQGQFLKKRSLKKTQSKNLGFVCVF